MTWGRPENAARHTHTHTHTHTQDVGDAGPPSKRSKTMAADGEAKNAATENKGDTKEDKGNANEDKGNANSTEEDLEAHEEEDDQHLADRLEDHEDAHDSATGEDKHGGGSKGDSEDASWAGVLPQHDPSRPLPAWALDAASNDITEEEKLAVPEFFCGRPIKTPERYLGIRKHLQKLWEQHKVNANNIKI